MTHASDPALLCLHAVRILGFASEAQTASRFGLDRRDVDELLLDFQAYGWASHSAFAGSGGWSLTDAGRLENERQLGVELDGCGARAAVAAAHASFVPLNSRFLETVTRWQVRPNPDDAMAPNDHTDVRWDDRVIDSLVSLGRRLARVGAELESELARFDGYAERFSAAANRVRRGEGRWVDGLGIDSCHGVWMQLHEDLVATLGIERGD